jgi:hypothetical protein
MKWPVLCAFSGGLGSDDLSRLDPRGDRDICVAKRVPLLATAPGSVSAGRACFSDEQEMTRRNDARSGSLKHYRADVDGNIAGIGSRARQRQA